MKLFDIFGTFCWDLFLTVLIIRGTAMKLFDIFGTFCWDLFLTVLIVKAPITTAADDIHKYFFIVFQRKYDLIFQVNPLLVRGFT